MSRDFKRKSTYLLALFLLASCASAQQPSGSTDSATATVLKVIDGDTIVLKLQNQTETVRLLGVDTPETVHPTKDVECFGPEASTFTRTMLKEGAVVKLARDVEPRDRFQRLLAYLYLADGTFFNQLLIDQGFARNLSIEPNTTFASQFASHESTARDRRVGLWQACER